MKGNRTALRVIPLGLIVSGLAVYSSGGSAQSPSGAALVSWKTKSIVYVKASNARKESEFGSGVVLSGDGNTMAVAAQGEGSVATGVNGNQGDISALRAGAVYIFTRRGDTWSQQAYIKASNAEAGDEFGCALALSSDGNTLAVGALYEDSAATGINGDQADNSASAAGAVYVFTRRDATWSQQAYVKASNTKADDQFGYSLAVGGDGNTLAVGAVSEDSAATGINGNQADHSIEGAGAVYVFSRRGSAWSQQAYVKGERTGQGFMFGYSVSLNSDGNKLAVGAFDETENKAVNEGEGAAYVFARRGTVWSQEAHLKASNAERGDSLGCSIAISADGNTLAAGAFDEDSLLTGIQPPNAGANDRATNTSAGAAYVFAHNGNTWSQQAYVKASNTGSNDWFGVHLALSSDGKTLAVASSLEDSSATGINGNQASDSASEAGAVYVFSRSGTSWSQQAYVKASNTKEFDEFGSSVALSSDGSTMAVGAHFESSSANEINGSQVDHSAKNAGAVYVYH